MEEPAPSAWRERIRAEAVFVRRTVIVFVLGAVALFLWHISATVLLVFAAILLAVILRAVASLLERYAAIPHKLSFYLSIVLLVALMGGTIYFFGAQVRGQIVEVIERLPGQVEALADQVGISDPWGEIETQLDGGAGASIVGRAAGFGFSVLGAIFDVFIVVVAAVYLAYNPRLYRRGVVSLFPPHNRAGIDKALLRTGRTLKLWFLGQLATMFAVGVMSGLAYWWLGLPTPVALGLIAGVTNFIPFIGPIIGAIPAMLFAFNISLDTFLWALGLVILVQQIESNILVPIIQKKAVALPPALGLFAIVTFGVVFGFLGVLLAVPLAVAVMVLVRELWVKGVLERQPAP
jgi:predicted PurR-regulated permease PerM